jgi:hypothetical protein
LEAWYDGVDQDCDGADDWDADADGYRADVDDCDDFDPMSHPGGEDRCSDGLDQDCDGAPHPDCQLEGEASFGDANMRFLGSDRGENSGHSFAAAQDDQAATGVSILVGSTSHDLNGAVQIVRDFHTGDNWLSEADATWSGEAIGDNAGVAVASKGDLDDDGGPDVVVSSTLNANAAGGSGTIYVIPLDAEGAHSLADAPARWMGEASDAQAGCDLLTPGDVDGDGFADLVIGASDENDWQGAVYFIRGPTSGDHALSEADGVLRGQNDGDDLGFDLASGDLDGDGVTDLLVGASLPEDGDEEGPGAALLLSGAPSGVLTPAEADAIVRGRGEELAGRTLDNAGDVDGDGYEDLLLGALGRASSGGEEWGGGAYLVLGPIAGESDVTAAVWDVFGDLWCQQIGHSVAGAGDVDQDGFADVLLGDRDGCHETPGQAALFFGPLRGSVLFDDADFLATGEVDYDRAGYTVAGVGDVDGDGFPDFMAGAPGYTDDEAYQGAAYLWLGGRL